MAYRGRHPLVQRLREEVYSIFSADAFIVGFFISTYRAKLKNKRKEVINMIKELNRINELAKKQREDGLTGAEKIEQQKLREDYLSQIRGQVLHTFSGLKVVDPLGNDVTPKKVRDL